MPPVLVSIEHGHARLTLAAEADVAVERLLPALADACGADASATLALLPRGGAPIDPRRSLREAGVLPGALLALRRTVPGERRQPGAGRLPLLPGVARPVWAPLRVGGALVAAAQASPVPGGPVARAGRAWRATAHAALLERAVAGARPPGGVVIAVASAHPGRGTTTVAALLAVLLSWTRTQPPLAIDGDLASGALSRHLAPGLRLAPRAYQDVVAGRLRADGLAAAGQGPYEVGLLPAPAGPVPSLDAADCTELLSHLRAAGHLVVLDCPAGFRTPWGQAAWAAADQVVLVGGDGPFEMAALAIVARSLTGAGAPVVGVIDRARYRRRTRRTAAAMDLTCPLVALPDDPASAADLRAGLLWWPATPNGWRRPMAQVAAALAATWV